MPGAVPGQARLAGRDVSPLRDVVGILEQVLGREIGDIDLAVPDDVALVEPAGSEHLDGHVVMITPGANPTVKVRRPAASRTHRHQGP